MEKSIRLYKAFWIFIEAIRNLIINEFGENWQDSYVDNFKYAHKNEWHLKAKEIKDPKYLIDFGNLKSFALNRNNLEILQNRFGRRFQKLGSKFDLISETRNLIAHFNIYDENKATAAYIYMIEIAENFELFDLKEEIEKIRFNTNLEIETGKSEGNPININSTSPINIRPKNTNQKGSRKKHAITLLQEYTGSSIYNNSNTFYSSINSAKNNFWLNIKPSKFNDEVNILLADNDALIWIQIPQGTIEDPGKYFKIRQDKNMVDLTIPIKGEHDYLKDTKKAEDGFDFRSYVKGKIPYNIKPKMTS